MIEFATAVTLGCLALAAILFGTRVLWVALRVPWGWFKALLARMGDKRKCVACRGEVAAIVASENDYLCRKHQQYLSRIEQLEYEEEQHRKETDAELNRLRQWAAFDYISGGRTMEDSYEVHHWGTPKPISHFADGGV